MKTRTSCIGRFVVLFVLLLVAAHARIGSVNDNEFNLNDLQEEARRLGTSLEEELLGWMLHAVQQDFEKIQATQHQHNKQRKLERVPCNTLIDTLTVDQIQGILVDKVANNPNGFVSRLAFAVNILLPRLLPWVLSYDVQFWKLCGKCSDFTEDELAGNCLPHEYSYNATHSGLFIAPVTRPSRSDPGGKFLEDTLPVNFVWSAGGLVSSEIRIDTLGTNGSEFGDALALLGGFLASGARSYTIVPDYLGYGESEDKYRVFLVRRSYTATAAAMALAAEKLVKEHSNCSAATADAYTLTGYSEGGYAAVAGAEALRDMGKTIINVYAGGGPFRVSSSVMITATKHIVEEDLQASYLLLGATFSNTTTDVANYGKGQNYLNDLYRDTIIETTMGYVGRSDARTYPDNIPKNYSVFNLDMAPVFYEGGVLRGEKEPCITSVTNLSNYLCRALQDQDLIETLETATYPVMLCHSSEDPDISYDNEPNISANPKYLSLKTVTGNHGEALFHCAQQIALYFSNSFNVKRYPVADKTIQGGCAAANLASTNKDKHWWCFRGLGWTGLC